MEKKIEFIDVSDMGKWEKFDPKNIIKEGYDVHFVKDSEIGFEIVLRDYSKFEVLDEYKDIRILFNDGVDLYRNIDESFSYGSTSGASLFIKINNSKYISWLVNVSCCLGDNHAKDIGFRHFMFIGSNDILDVISTYDPIIEYLDK